MINSCEKTKLKGLFMVSEVFIPDGLAPLFWNLENAGQSELLTCWWPGSGVTLDWVRKDRLSMT